MGARWKNHEIETFLFVKLESFAHNGCLDDSVE